MKKTIDFYEFRDAFKDLRPNNFSYEGLEVLWEHFLEYEESTGTEIELDVIAICCDYTESTIEEALKNYGLNDYGFNIIEKLEQETIVLPIPGTDRIIYLNY